MFLDEHVLTRLFEGLGFEVVEAKKIGLNYESKAWQLDGREAVYFEAMVPKV